MQDFVKFDNGYSTRAFKGDLAEILRDLEAATQRANVTYDTLIGTGLSGALVVPYLAVNMKLHWSIVRKNETHHSSNQVEGSIGRRWLFVDDFTSTGGTYERVRTEVAKAIENINRFRVDLRFNDDPDRFVTELVGCFLYQRTDVGIQLWNGS